MSIADLDIPAWLAALLLEQERDRRERDQRIQIELPEMPADEEE